MDEVVPAGALRVKVAFSRYERTMAQREAMKGGPLWRRPVVVFGGVALLIGLVPGLLHNVLHPAVPEAAKVALSIVAIVLAAFGLKRVVQEKEEAERHEEHPDVYTLSDAGLEISGSEDLTLMSWASMTRVHETKQFFLFVADKEVQYIPKRVLYEERLDIVRALIARCAPGAARAIPSSSGSQQEPNRSDP